MGKTAIITGGSRGIGAACVSLFLERGYNVAFSYCNSLSSANVSHPNCRAFKCDVAIEGDCAALIEGCLKAFGGIDVLVNNAGISHTALLQDMSAEEVSRVLSVNLTGAINLTRMAIPHMLNTQASVVNISSVFGVRGASCEAVYSASKAGLIGFTQGLSREMGLSGVRVNAVAPGAVGTDMLSGLSANELTEIASQTALGRIGKPCEIAEVVEFLASERSRYITGQCIIADGGWI